MYFGSIVLFVGQAIALFVDEPYKEEKCYSCSSANFDLRWPKDRNNTLLYLTNAALISNETCDSLRASLPVVSCPNSVCVKFVVTDSASSRAVCSSLQNPVIVRDCWSRVLHSFDSQLQLRPLSTKPVKLETIAGQKQTIGQIYSCSGYLCNNTQRSTVSVSFILFLVLFFF
ncbi:hypothetical protein M3Y94_00170800 [Aphelenchoides besseyi]|nr:hypothetical protein M3Y94_00170800 [Aphelenchoides besseyi]KAI6236981.1 hypothetical protein M3Y95_00216700 [Aphelenchoides besseyi]